MTKLLSLSLICLLFSALTFANDRKHFQMQSREGVIIDLDYVIDPQSFKSCAQCHLFTFSSPVTVTILHRDLRPTDHVRIVLINVRSNVWGHSRDVKEYDLVYAYKGAFIAHTERLPLYAIGSTGNDDFTQEIALVINGQWMKTKTHQSNFHFKLLY